MRQNIIFVALSALTAAVAAQSSNSNLTVPVETVPENLRSMSQVIESASLLGLLTSPYHQTSGVLPSTTPARSFATSLSRPTTATSYVSAIWSTV